MTIEPAVYLNNLGSLDSEFTLREMLLLLLLPESLGGSLTWGQAAANGAGFLGSQVQRLILLVLIVVAELFPLCLGDDSQYSGNRLPDLLDLPELGWGASSNLLGI